MKERSSLGFWAIILFALLFAAFLGYRIFGAREEKIVTIDATEVTVEEKITADAVFIRDQSPVSGKKGTPEYLIENGEKVQKDQGICIFFTDRSAQENYDKLKEVTEKIAALNYTDMMLSNGTDGAKLDVLIHDRLSDISKKLISGKVSDFKQDYLTLQRLAEARDEGAYDKSAARIEIASLENEAKNYRKLIGRASSTVSAPFSGYFITSADGLEKVFSTSCIKELNADYIKRDSHIPESTDGAIGSIVNGFYWYFAISADKEQTERFSSAKEKGKTLDVYFQALKSAPEQFTVYAINRNPDGSSVVVFKSPVMRQEYLSTRFQSADIVLDSYKGIRIPHAALHQKDGKWGVYCIDGTKVKFKEVIILYQTDSFYLLKTANTSKEGIYLYDKVVIEGFKG